MTKSYVMSKRILTQIAKSGNYPFCHYCGNPIEVGDTVYPVVTSSTTRNKTKYFCKTCWDNELMYVDGKRKEN